MSIQFFYPVTQQIFIYNKLICTHQRSKRQRTKKMFTGYCWVTKTTCMGSSTWMRPGYSNPPECESTYGVLAVLTFMLCWLMEPMNTTASLWFPFQNFLPLQFLDSCKFDLKLLNHAWCVIVRVLQRNRKCICVFVKGSL